jgi:hypothetical protein
MSNIFPICRTFQSLSKRTWRIMRDGTIYKCMPSEESITDFLLLDLKRRHQVEIQIVKFSQKQEGTTTGADWEWWFGDGSNWFGIRVQAKKISPIALTYSQLDKVSGGTGRKQVDLLIADAKCHGLWPIYILYNYWTNSRKASPPWRCKSFPQSGPLWGCSFADADSIKGQIANKQNSLYDIGMMMMPWHCLVCCRGYARENATLPYRAHGIAKNLISKGEIPDITKQLPAHILKSLDLAPKNLRMARDDNSPNFGREGIDGFMVIQENL